MFPVGTAANGCDRPKTCESAKFKQADSERKLLQDIFICEVWREFGQVLKFEVPSLELLLMA